MSQVSDILSFRITLLAQISHLWAQLLITSYYESFEFFAAYIPLSYSFYGL